MTLLFILLVLISQITFSKELYRDNRLRIELVSSKSKLVQGDTLLLAVKVTLAKGWHIYWLNPGDAGEPTILEIKTNIPSHHRVVPTYPPPVIKIENEILTLEYRDVVYFPFTLVFPKNFAQNLELELNAKWLVCKEKCIPGKTHIKKVFPIGKNLSKNEIDTKLCEKLHIFEPDTLLAKISFTDETTNLIFETPFETNLKSIFFFPKNEGLFDLRFKPEFYLENQHTIVQLKMLQYIWGEKSNIEGILEVTTSDSAKKYFHVKIVN